MHKLRTQILLSFNFFMLVIILLAMLFYFFFATDYYVAQKISVINSAFTTLHQMDLSLVAEEKEDPFTLFDEESFYIIICDHYFQPLYTNISRNVADIISSQIQTKQEQYSRSARASLEEDTPGRPVSLRGVISQGGEEFYVYIYENTRNMQKSIQYANRFLIQILVIILVFGSAFAYLLSRWLVRPISDIQRVTEKIAQNDFSSRVTEKMPRNELGQLAGNINHMADKIQRDINDLNNYNYLLLKQNRDMAEFEDLRKKLVSSITHELKTPLAIISSQVELLQYEYDESKKDYYFSSIMEEIDKMSSLISSILKNSVLENRIQNAERELTNLSELLNNQLPKYETWLSTKKIRLFSEIQKGCLSYVDPLQIEQAVNNYVMNACRHTHAGGMVTITLKSEPEWFYLSVYNEGEPIPDAEAEHIWTSFYQLKNRVRNDAFTEIGLGLYIVRDITLHHGGTCGVTNKEGGVEFYIRLPKNA